MIDESSQEAGLIMGASSVLKAAWGLAEAGWEALFSSAGDAIPASGFQILAGYNLAGTFAMAGDTYTMNIAVITASADAEGLGALTDAIVSQAESAGATDIEITGSTITRSGFFNQSYMESFGWTWQQIDSSTVLLTMSLQ
jgi:hypothetical protein